MLFRSASTELGRNLKGDRVIQLHVSGRLCVADTQHGRAVVRACSGATLWVRDGRYLAGVRTTNMNGLPSYLAAFSGHGGVALGVVTLNGYRIGWQEWAAMSRKAA